VRLASGLPRDVLQQSSALLSVCLLIVLLLLGGCSRDTAVNLSDLAARAKTGERAAIVKLVELLAAPEGKVAEQAYPNT
jgi:Tfp pilus assembly protein PilP